MLVRLVLASGMRQGIQIGMGQVVVTGYSPYNNSLRYEFWYGIWLLCFILS